MSAKCDRNEQELTTAPATGSNAKTTTATASTSNAIASSITSTLGHHRQQQQASIDHHSQQQQQQQRIKLLHQSAATTTATASASVIVASTDTTATITPTSSNTAVCSCCNVPSSNGNNCNNNFHRARRKLHVPSVGHNKDHPMAECNDHNNGYHQQQQNNNNHHHNHNHHQHHNQNLQQQQSRNRSCTGSDDDVINQCRDICNCDYGHGSSSNGQTSEYLIQHASSKITLGKDHHVPSSSSSTSSVVTNGPILVENSSKNVMDLSTVTTINNASGGTCTISKPQGKTTVATTLSSGNSESVVNNMSSKSGNGGNSTLEGVSFKPSPEILFLVREHAKTLETLSCINKRLEQLEVKVCDIQRTVNNSTLQLSSNMASSTHCDLVHSKSSANNCTSDQQEVLMTHGKKHLGNNGILSDDSGGEYSRTTNGTGADEDELISLLDQIAKCSQQIRDTQASQVAVANHYLAMSNGNSLQQTSSSATSKESSQGTLVSDTRHQTIPGAIGGSSFLCSSTSVSHPRVALAGQSDHSSPVASCSISRHNSNTSTHSGTSSSVAALLGHRIPPQPQPPPPSIPNATALSHHVSTTSPGNTNDGRLASNSIQHLQQLQQQQQQQHLLLQQQQMLTSHHLMHSPHSHHHPTPLSGLLTQSTTSVLSDAPALATGSTSSSSLSALLFDSNISNVLTNLQDELTNDSPALTVIGPSAASSFLNQITPSSPSSSSSSSSSSKRYIGDITTGHVSDVSALESPIHHQIASRSPLYSHAMSNVTLSPTHLAKSTYEVRSISRSRVPSISQQQQHQHQQQQLQLQHVSPVFLPGSSTVVHNSSQQQRQTKQQQQQQQQIISPYTSVHLMRRSTGNVSTNLEGDPELTDVTITAATGGTNDANNSGINRVSNNSSGSINCNNSSNGGNIWKLDHMRRYVQQREQDECKTACDLADEWLAKHSSNVKEVTPANLTSPSSATAVVSTSSSSTSSSSSSSSLRPRTLHHHLSSTTHQPHQQCASSSSTSSSSSSRKGDAE